ncbi:serine/threonine-protein phosphatase [Candidatus Micrarchaeota archaeon]|nr:serine/threonine-protein phosphatase [Candidatus Micrarchaeota archaeon]
MNPRTTLRRFPPIRKFEKPRLEIEVHGATHIGGRPSQEDTFHTWDNGGMVADGMGGMFKGEVASGHVERAFKANEAWLVKEPQKLLDVIEEAHDAISLDPSIPSSKYGKEGGSTVASLAIDSQKHEAHVAHVGDSRVYLLRDGKLVQLTRDHSASQTLRDQGVEEKYASRYDNVLERALGMKDHEPDIKKLAVKHGDVFAIVSDGWKTLSEDQLKERLAKATSAKEAAESIVRGADAAGKKKGGEHDNITAVVLRVFAKQQKKS